MSHRSRFTLFAGIGPLKDINVTSEIIAGITLAALAIPEVLGYTSISGTPLVTGLYTLLLPVVLFAVFGGSRHLVVGADSATAAMLAAGLAGIATVRSDEYVALAGLLALMAAAFLLLARIIKLGFLSDFLSQTVLIGFLSGVGIQVTLSQVSGMLGISGETHGLPASIYHNFHNFSGIHLYTSLLSAGVIVLITGLKKISPKIPGPLIAVVGFILLSAFLDLEKSGVAMLGKVPGGLPETGLPDIDWSWQLLGSLSTTALSIFIVILTQSAATSRAFADKYNEPYNADKDLTGLAMANIGAAISGTFVVNGSPTKTQMVDSAGGRSQLSHLVMAAMVFLVLLFFTEPLAYMPSAVLSAIVFLIGIDLIDLRGMREIYSRDRPEFHIAMLTTLVVVFAGVKAGILVAMAVSLLNHVRHGYRPLNELIVPSKTHGWKTVPIEKQVQFAPGLLVYRFTHSLYYANAHALYSEVKELVSNPATPIRWFCIESSSIDDIDFSAAQTLRSVYKMLHEKNIRLVFSDVPTKTKKKFKRLGIEELVGKDAFYRTGRDVLAAYHKQYPDTRPENSGRQDEPGILF